MRSGAEEVMPGDVTTLVFWLTMSTQRLNLGKFQLGGAWIAGSPEGGHLPRGLELVRQLEALKIEQNRRGREAGHSWHHINSAIALEAYRRADLAVIAAAGLEDELVIPAGYPEVGSRYVCSSWTLAYAIMQTVSTTVGGCSRVRRKLST